MITMNSPSVSAFDRCGYSSSFELKRARSNKILEIPNFNKVSPWSAVIS